MKLTVLLLFFVTIIFAQKTIYTITKTDKTEYKAISYSSKLCNLKIITSKKETIEIPYNNLAKIEYTRNYRDIEENVALVYVKFSERNGVLMRVLKEGLCNLYVHEFQYSHFYVLRKGEQIATPIYLKQIISNNFKKTALKYFKDCSSLVEKIESKDFTKHNLLEIVDFYNSTCQ